ISRTERRPGKVGHRGRSIDADRSSAPLFFVTVAADDRKGMQAWCRIATLARDVNGALKPVKAIRADRLRRCADSRHGPGRVGIVFIKPIPISGQNKIGWQLREKAGRSLPEWRER